MSLSLLFRHFVLDNPMTQEGMRAWRRFLRTGGDTGRAVNYTILGLLGVLYLWLQVVIVHYRDDMSVELVMLEMGILTLAVPASLYGAISGEREKLTWDALILTRLTPGQILVGKLLWRLGMAVGILLVFLPPLLLSHYTGSHLRSSAPQYTLHGLVQAQAVLLCWSLLLASFSLWVSARTKRTVTSLMLVAVALFGFTILCPVLVDLFGGNQLLRIGDPPLKQLGAVLLDLHPLYYLFTVNEPATGRAAVSDVYDWAPWVYVVGAAASLYAAWRALRGLELARRKM